MAVHGFAEQKVSGTISIVAGARNEMEMGSVLQIVPDTFFLIVPDTFFFRHLFFGEGRSVCRLSNTKEMDSCFRR